MDLMSLTASIALDISGFRDGVDLASNLFNQLTKMARQQITFGVNLAFDFGKDVLNTGMGFSKEMSAVQAVLGEAEGTVENMTMLQQFGLDQAAKSIYTAEETAKAYYYMGMAGWKAEQMTAGLPGVLALAAASGEDLSRTSDIVTDSITAFGKDAGYTSKYVDILAQTATNSNTDVSRMGETFKYVAPLAGALGYEVEDVAVSIGLMANAGIKGSMAGTSLRNIFTRIATNAGQTEKDLGALSVITDKLGVSFYDAEGNARPWLEFLEEAREAWKGLDEQDKDAVLDAYVTFAYNGKDADEVMKNLAKDGQKMNDVFDTYNNTKSDTIRNNAEKEIRGLASSYTELFEILGMDINPDTDSLNELANSLDQARYKLGLMSDEEKIYFSKQIGSMRGMTGWLDLMSASEEDFEKLTYAIFNATGAAQRMADVKLDNLWGDLQKLNSEFDVLKNEAYLDIEDPLREVVQWVTGSVKDIREAIVEDGLMGGLNELTKKIEEGTDFLKPLLEQLGKSVAPMLATLIETTLPLVDNSIIQLGRDLASGVLSGLGDELEKHPFLATAAGLLGSAWKVDKTLTVDGVEVTVSFESIQAALDKAQENGDATITINGVTFPSDFSAVDVMDTFIAATDTCITDGFAQAVVEGKDIFGTEAPNMAGLIENAVGDAGTPAALTFAENFSEEMNRHSFQIKLNADVNGVPVQHNARAMSSGRIFTRPTIFGYADNALQVAGDAGPEAVVGVNSLHSMIAGAVNAAMGGQEVIVPRDSGRDITIILELDRQQFSKAVYKANNEQTQHVGVKLSGVSD